MKKNLGFSSFEFYFVVSVIGLILIVGFQRYYALLDETRRLSFEVLAQNFSAAVYSQRAHWIVAQQTNGPKLQLEIDGLQVQFSEEGWPQSVDVHGPVEQVPPISKCLSLWIHFLQNAPLMSVEMSSRQDAPYYFLSVTQNNSCRYHWVDKNQNGFYFEYSPSTGIIKTSVLSIAKDS